MGIGADGSCDFHFWSFCHQNKRMGPFPGPSFPSLPLSRVLSLRGRCEARAIGPRAVMNQLPRRLGELVSQAPLPRNGIPNSLVLK